VIKSSPGFAPTGSRSPGRSCAGPSPNSWRKRALAALQTLSAVAALRAPLVIVFDQLENLAERERSGERLNAYANLTSELVDAVRGAVLVHMALATEWTHGIQPTFNLSP
jgi:hypothetical protein